MINAPLTGILGAKASKIPSEVACYATASSSLMLYFLELSHA